MKLEKKKTLWEPHIEDVDFSKQKKLQLTSEEDIKMSICFIQEMIVLFARDLEIKKGVLNPIAHKIISSTGVDDILIPLKHMYFGVRNKQFED